VLLQLTGTLLKQVSLLGFCNNLLLKAMTSLTCKGASAMHMQSIIILLQVTKQVLQLLLRCVGTSTAAADDVVLFQLGFRRRKHVALTLQTLRDRQSCAANPRTAIRGSWS
jgi:hypothetical protein